MKSRVTHRWSAVALASSSLFGCEHDDPDDSFRITGVSFDGASTITLTFSQPVANAGEIDPNDFRISVGLTYRTIYAGPDGNVTGERARYADLGYYVGNTTRLGWASFSSGADDQLTLQAELAFATVCDDIADYVATREMYQTDYYDPMLEMGMFVHYAAGDIPIRSDEGETLTDIGPDWVLSDEGYMLVFDALGFPNLNPKLEIPCP